jgi:hypothetical protein
MRSRFLFVLVVILCLTLSACSSPPPPTGDNYFADAKNNLEAMDYDSALRNLERAISAAGEQPQGQQATLVRIALLTAMADGANKMADAYETGRRQPVAGPRFGQLSQIRTDYYGVARVHLLNAMEAMMKQRAKLGDKPMPLALKFPAFSGAESPVMARILKGMAVSDEERYRVQLDMTRNALAATLAGMVGAGDNVHKGHEIFNTGNVEIDPRVYLIHMTEAFHKLSEIFGSKALDDAKYHKVSLEVVRDNLELASKLLAAKPDKDLEARIKKCRAECDKQLKKLGT